MTWFIMIGLFFIKKKSASSRQNFRTKDDFVNVVKQWHIAQSLEYHVQLSNQTFVQLQCIHTPKYQWYLHGGYHKRSDSLR